MRPFNRSDLFRMEKANCAAMQNPKGFRMDAVKIWARMFATLWEAVNERNDMKTALAAQCMKAINREAELGEELESADIALSDLRGQRQSAANAQADAEEDLESHRFQRTELIDQLRIATTRHVSAAEKLEGVRAVLRQYTRI